MLDADDLALSTIRSLTRRLLRGAKHKITCGSSEIHSSRGVFSKTRYTLGLNQIPRRPPSALKSETKVPSTIKSASMKS